MVLSKSTNQIRIGFCTVLKPIAMITTELLIILEIIEEIVLATCTFKPIRQSWKPSRSANCDPPSITRSRQNALRKLHDAGKALTWAKELGYVKQVETDGNFVSCPNCGTVLYELVSTSPISCKGGECSET